MTKKKRAETAKFTCPLCRKTRVVHMSEACKDSCKCPACNKIIKAKTCCIFCDYSDKTCKACTPTRIRIS